MNDLAVTALLVAALFVILASGVWIGLTLSGVAWIGMELFSSRPAGDAMAVTIWGSSSSWTLTALPLFVWMGEILFRTRLSQDMGIGRPAFSIELEPAATAGRTSMQHELRLAAETDSLANRRLDFLNIQIQ